MENNFLRCGHSTYAVCTEHRLQVVVIKVKMTPTILTFLVGRIDQPRLRLIPGCC